MDTSTARDVAAKRKPGQQVVNKFAKPQNHEGDGHQVDEEMVYDHASNQTPKKKTTGRGIKRTDSFAINFRIPAKYEYAVLMAATIAKASGQIRPSAKRDDKQAFLEQFLMDFIEELFEEHPLPKAK